MLIGFNLIYDIKQQQRRIGSVALAFQLVYYAIPIVETFTTRLAVWYLTGESAETPAAGSPTNTFFALALTGSAVALVV